MCLFVGGSSQTIDFIISMLLLTAICFSLKSLAVDDDGKDKELSPHKIHITWH